jgi:hypothetical protein
MVIATQKLNYKPNCKTPLFLIMYIALLVLMLMFVHCIACGMVRYYPIIALCRHWNFFGLKKKKKNSLFVL